MHGNRALAVPSYRDAIRVAAVLAALLLTSGCSAGSTADALGSATASASSAAASALLAFELRAKDEASDSIADTTWRDATTQLLDAHRSTVELSPSDATERATQDDALAAIRSALDAVRLAESAAPGDGAAELALRTSAEALDELSTNLEVRP